MIFYFVLTKQKLIFGLVTFTVTEEFIGIQVIQHYLQFLIYNEK